MDLLAQIVQLVIITVLQNKNAHLRIRRKRKIYTRQNQKPIHIYSRKFPAIPKDMKNPLWYTNILLPGYVTEKMQKAQEDGKDGKYQPKRR